jgi:ATP-dependent protease ClpP protease subunit
MSDDSSIDREEDRDEVKTILEIASAYHDRGLHLPKRAIYLGSETFSSDGDEIGVDAAMADTFIRNMHILEGLSSDPITTYLNSCGGDVYHGLAIYDAIKLSPCEVNIYVRGYAMSMGSIILQAATRRFMSPNAVQMVHYGTDSISHHSKTVIKRAAESERVNDWMERMYLARIKQKQPRFTLAKLKKLLDHDTYLTADASIDLGLADRIG